MKGKYVRLGVLYAMGLFLALQPVWAQEADYPILNQALYRGLQWRSIGPYRGGRCTAICGVVQKPLTYYMGSSGGGLWQTDDAGMSWRNISDGFFSSGSIGAIAVSESDPNILYAGTGEHAVRAHTTTRGDGVYKSTDAGRTWTHIGLIHAHHIAAIRIHPNNPDVVYVAVQGELYAPNTRRGVYRSTDGGRNWERVLHVNATTGAADLALNPANPRILYAALWDHQRSPWAIRSGGPGSGLYKSSDGGDNWEKMAGGLPTAIGKAGIDVARSDPDRLFAVVEAEQGGVFRSDDGGQTWILTQPERITYARSWYYNKIAIDPQDKETVYVLNAPLLRSIDGGKNFQPIENPHTDQHALWIHPAQPNYLALGNDGGATISLNGGKSWSPQNNQPTGQFYRVITDQSFPYKIYSAQQDYNTIAISSRADGPGIGAQAWREVGPGESGFVAFDPQHPDPVFSSAYLGEISSYSPSSNLLRDLTAYPAPNLAVPARDMPYRFNWNAPLVADPQHPGTLLHGAQKVLRSQDGGLSWKAISPDLTRNDPAHLGPSGGPFTNEGAGAEVYHTLSYLACSPQQAGTIWAGSDDGLLHLTRNGGQDWEKISPPDLGEAHIQHIELSPHDPASAYLVATRHRFGDYRPLIYKTTDYGKHWMPCTEGISQDNPVRVVREDPLRKGLLYAGTERGFYLSYDAGTTWHRLQGNLPICPISDLTIRENDLIAATEGRGLFILDDLSPLQQHPALTGKEFALLSPKPAVRSDEGVSAWGPDAHYGQNPPSGTWIAYCLPEKRDPSPLKLEILNDKNQVLRSFSNTQPTPQPPVYEGGPPAEPLLPALPGLNRFEWDLRRATLPGIPNAFISGDYRGGLVPPGTYTLRLILGRDTLTTSVSVLAPPGTAFPAAAYRTQEELLLALERQIRDMHHSALRMRLLRDQVRQLVQYFEQEEELRELAAAGKALLNRVDEWEKSLLEPRQRTAQDVINFPGKLSADCLQLKARIDGADPRVTEGGTQRLAELKQAWQQHRLRMEDIIHRELASFKKSFQEKDIPGLIMPGVNSF